MSYHKLSNESGGTNEDRANEADRICQMLDDSVRGRMTSKEQGFVRETEERIAVYGSGAFVSTKQLFWLRDLKEKYL